jgi:hypothetical protein
VTSRRRFPQQKKQPDKETTMKKLTRSTKQQKTIATTLSPDQLEKVNGGFNPQPDPPGDIPRIPFLPRG